MTAPQTMLDKIWNAHIVTSKDDVTKLIYVDMQLLNEATSSQAFEDLRQTQRDTWRPDRTIATLDRNVYSKTSKSETIQKQFETLVANCKEYCIGCFGIGNVNQGLLYVMAPEQGFIQPGMTVVGPNTQVATCGAFGTLAFSVSPTEIECVLASQSLPMSKPKSMEIRIDGKLAQGVTAKDLALYLLSQLANEDLSEYCIEFTGDVIRNLSMTGRMTLCNTFSSKNVFSCMVAPDELTFKYLKGRPHCPIPGREFDLAIAKWKQFRSDDGCQYDKSVQFDVTDLAPQVSWGGQTIAIDGTDSGQKSIADLPVDCVFIGSASNGRLGDLRAVAKVVKGYKCSPNVTAVISPGSGLVKVKAELAGLDKIFIEAGFQWNNPGSAQFENDAKRSGLCIVSTGTDCDVTESERVYQVSPLTAAATAITGKFTDVRNWEYK